MIGIEGRLQVRNYENRSPALSSEALSSPQLVGQNISFTSIDLNKRQEEKEACEGFHKNIILKSTK